MNKLKCDLVVFEIGMKDRLEKEQMHTATLVGSLRLKPDNLDPAQGELGIETVQVKVVISDVAQLDLLRACGLGKKGDAKELILQVPPQQALIAEGFEA